MRPALLSELLLLLTRLRPVLEDYEAALESINHFRDKPRGQLRVTIAAPAADLIMAPVVARFLAQYPEIKLEISVDDALTDIVAPPPSMTVRFRLSDIERSLFLAPSSRRNAIKRLPFGL